MNNSDNWCGGSSFSLQEYPSNGEEAMHGFRSLVFTMRESYLGHSYKAYLDDTKTFVAKPGNSFYLPSYTLFDGSKEHVLAYAKCYSSAFAVSTKWEVRQGGKQGLPIANIINKGRKWWVSMGESTADDLRIDKHSLTRTTIIKDGVMVAQFARKKWYRRAREFRLCVSSEEQLWVLLLLYALVNFEISARNC